MSCFARWIILAKGVLNRPCMLKPVSILIPYQRKNGEVHLWTQLRDSSDQLNGRLEFPGGKIEEGETPLGAVIREVKEEVGVELSTADLFSHYNFDGGLLIYVFLYDDSDGVFTLDGYKTLQEYQAEPDKILPNNREILATLKTYFQQVSE